MFTFFHLCSTFLVQETASKDNAGRINLILISHFLKYFSAPLHEKTYLKEAYLYQQASFIDLKFKTEIVYN